MKTLHFIKFTCFFFFFTLLYSCQPSNSKLELPALFSENMVIQQNTDAIIWGKATPGTNINISADWGSSTTAKAMEDSSWQATLKTIEAGGPYTLTIEAPDTSIVIRNVLLGEVWLASGQSNMEMPVAGWPPRDTILHSANAIATSGDKNIRFFKVARKTAVSPIFNVDGNWEISNPKNTGAFSATAYFFALKLYEELNIPIGIIQSSWGGTPIETWISKEKLITNSDFSTIAEKFKKIIPEEEAFQKWINSQKWISVKKTPNKNNPYKDLDVFDQHCSAPNTNTDNWLTTNLPGIIEQIEAAPIDGVVWFRKVINIPESWEGKNIVVSLGPIDDMDVTYLNGQRIGGIETGGHWQTKRLYTVPGEKIKSGKAVLAVKVIDTQGNGGFIGQPEMMTIYPESSPNEAISLAGEWKYKVVGQLLDNNKLYVFDPTTNAYESQPKRSMVINSHTPTVLFNGMIAPLIPYSLKGTIWYQGEANVGRAKQYLQLMELLINDWRERFKNPEMPFYYVQLAPYHYKDAEGPASAWLREAQRRAVKIPHTGMVVTLDVGNVNNIHPANKPAVGKRLAFWALANTYEKDLPFSGPIPSKIEKFDNKIIISFEHTYGQLIIKNVVNNQFEIAAKDGRFVPAETKIIDNKIEVFSPKILSPTNVRYAFRNGAEAALFNAAGLPAPSFTTEEIIEK